MICVVIEYANDDRGYRMLEALRTLGEITWTARSTPTDRLMVLFDMGGRPYEVVMGIVLNAERAAGLTDHLGPPTVAGDLGGLCPETGKR